MLHLLSMVKISVKRIYEDQIRPHLLTYLKSGFFNELPSRKPGATAIHAEKKTMKFDVFCNCRFPWVWCQSKNKDLNKEQCDSCKTDFTGSVKICNLLNWYLLNKVYILERVGKIL